MANKFEEFAQVFKMVTGVSVQRAIEAEAQGKTHELMAEVSENVRRDSLMSDPFYCGLREMAMDGNPDAMAGLIGITDVPPAAPVTDESTDGVAARNTKKTNPGI